MSLRSFASTFDYHILHSLFMFHRYCFDFFMRFFFYYYQILNIINICNELENPLCTTSKCLHAWTVSFVDNAAVRGYIILLPGALPHKVYGLTYTSWILFWQDRALKWQQIITKGEFVITSHNEILLRRGSGGVRSCSVLKPHKQNATMCISQLHSLLFCASLPHVCLENICGLVYPLRSKVMWQKWN